MQKPLFFLVALITLNGCHQMAIKKNITGNYYFVAADDPARCCLSYHEEGDGVNYSCLIGFGVFAAGYNDKYMIIKQHPVANKKVTNYYILSLEKEMDWITNNGLMGPLGLEEFTNKCHELQIPIIFTYVLKDLE